MDDQPGNDSNSPTAASSGPVRRPIEVKTDGEVANLAAPTVEPPTPAETPEPTASPFPSADSDSQPPTTPPESPEVPPTDPASPEAAPAPTPPTPGDVVTGGQVPPAAAAPLVAASGSGGNKRWLKRLVALLAVVVLLIAGWFIYDHFLHKTPVAAPTTKNKTIPLLKVGILSADYGNLYPDASPSAYNYLVNGQMFEGLVRYQNKSKIAPDLASTWTNPDDKTWLFTLKPDVQFHDGNTLEPADVKYSLDSLIASNSDYAQTFAGSIAAVETVGTNQVKITTKAPDPALLNKLTFLYIIDDKPPAGQNASVAGTGPYQVRPGTTPSANEVQMVAFNDYHGGKPTTQALTFGTEETADGLVKAFQAGQFNIVGPIPPADAKQVSGATEFVTSEPDVAFLGFNTVKAGPLQNKQVREAIRYAVNPGAIGKARSGQVTPISQLIPQEVPGYNPTITPYKQDIEKAKKLLAQAGYPNGLTVRLSTADTKEATDELVKELKQVGITATVDQHSDFDEFIDYFSSGQAELFTVNYASDTLDGLDIYQTTLNSANYNNPKLTEALNQASTTTDPAKRLKLLQEAATIINDDVAVVPFSTEDNVWLTDKQYAIQQDLPSSFISVYFYKVQLK